MDPGNTTNSCIICGKTENLSSCAKCRSASYCGRDHQKSDWKRHKSLCNQFLKNHNMNNNSRAEIEEPSSTTNNVFDQRTIFPTSDSGATFMDIDIPFMPGIPSSSSKLLSQVQCPRHDAAYSLGDDFLSLRASGVPDTDESLHRSGSNSSMASGMYQNDSQTTLHKSESNSSMTSLPSRKDSQISISSMASLSLARPTDFLSEDRLASLAIRVSDDILHHGICVVDNFLGADKGTEILHEVIQLQTEGKMKPGQVVSKQSQGVEKIRGDQIIWIEGVEEGVDEIRYLISYIDQLIMYCTKYLDMYTINGRTKAMVAVYPAGGTGYVRHVDNPNADGRCITAIYYLNKNWDVHLKGGLLRIYPDGKNLVANIEPLFDRILFFWSDRRNPHEVQPSYDVRYAITVWYFDAKERAQAKEKYRTLGERERKHSIPLSYRA